jgi:hypothetical protein
MTQIEEGNLRVSESHEVTRQNRGIIEIERGR